MAVSFLKSMRRRYSFGQESIQGGAAGTCYEESARWESVEELLEPFSRGLQYAQNGDAPLLIKGVEGSGVLHVRAAGTHAAETPTGCVVYLTSTSRMRLAAVGGRTSWHLVGKESSRQHAK